MNVTNVWEDDGVVADQQQMGAQMRGAKGCGERMNIRRPSGQGEH